jgi:glycosyltransferase involved in cell wall biosynthesis
MRDRLLVANSANDMANKILSFLQNPRQYDSPLAELQAIARSDFSWERKAEDLVSLIRLDGGLNPGSMAETVGKRG